MSSKEIGRSFNFVLGVSILPLSRIVDFGDVPTERNVFIFHFLFKYLVKHILFAQMCKKDTNF